MKTSCASDTREYLNHLSSIIFNSALTVHKEMGPGLLEGVYHHCMVHELRIRGLGVSVMKPVALYYKGSQLNKDYIIDILVENEIILELKALETLHPVHEAQIISYLKLSNKRMGFLINFNVPLLKDGFRRFVNRF